MVYLLIIFSFLLMTSCDDIYTYLQSMAAVSPDGSHFVSVTLFGQIIERTTQNTIWGYPFVTADNDYVYSVLNGTDDVNCYDKIAIYSWRGEAVKLLRLNRNILRICVDDGLIYAIAVSSDGELVLSKVSLS